MADSAAAAVHCDLVSSFVARQSIILIAGIAFLLYTYARVRCGYEKRDLATFCADVSKQGGQQMIGGALMALTAVMLEGGELGLDALAWYGAEYPFEIVLTTTFTSWLRNGCDGLFGWLHRKTQWPCVVPFVNFGMYGPTPGTFYCSWYAAQMVQAVLIIGLGARISSVLFIVGSLEVLPEECASAAAPQTRRPVGGMVELRSCARATRAQVQPRAARGQGMVLLGADMCPAHSGNAVRHARRRRRHPVHHHRLDPKVQGARGPAAGERSQREPHVTPAAAALPGAVPDGGQRVPLRPLPDERGAQAPAAHGGCVERARRGARRARRAAVNHI